MKNESSHLVSGMLFGALIGACATYLIIKNKAKIKQEFEQVSEKVRHGVHEFEEKAREKVGDFGEKIYEKANKASGNADNKSQDLNNPA